MADQKVSALTALTAAQAAADDLLYVVDISAGVAGSKKMLLSEVLQALATLTSADPLIFKDGTAVTVRDTLTVQKAGGTPGIDQMQFSYDITPIVDSSTQFEIRQGGTRCIQVYSGGIQRMLNGVGFGASIVSAPDVGLLRVSAGVLSLTAGDSGSGTLSSIPVSPTGLTGNTNNWAPGVGRYIRITSNGSYDLTGLVAGVDGQEVFLVLVSNVTITLKNQSGSSTSANQFLFNTGADVALTQNKGIGLWYDATTGAWRGFA